MHALQRPAIDAYMIGSHWEGLPSMSPFGLKLATWLRMAEVPHRLLIEDNPMKGPKRKSPWIVENGHAMGDSHLIIRHLEAQGHAGIDGHLTPEQRGMALHFARSLENHLHQAVEHGLFLDDNGWKASVAHFSMIPQPIRFFVLPLIRRDTRKANYTRGIGRHSLEEMQILVEEDVAAAAAMLGDKPYLFGERPCTADAVAYGFFAVMVWAPFEWFGRDAVWRHPNLVAYCERIRDRYWSEGEAQAVA
ncbi:MAG: glutathione S-transferase family protein [Myxococcota bacterium]